MVDVLGNGLVSIIPLIGTAINKGTEFVDNFMKTTKDATEWMKKNVVVESKEIDDVTFKLYENLSDFVKETVTNQNLENIKKIDENSENNLDVVLENNLDENSENNIEDGRITPIPKLENIEKKLVKHVQKKLIQQK